MKTLSAFFFLSLYVLLSGCCKKDAPQPLDQLPPATQEGKNTFGCLLNGQAWTPKGYSGTSNYSVYYDPGYGGGTLNISVYRYASKNENDLQTISLNSFKLTTVGSYSYTDNYINTIIINDVKSNCRYDSYDSLNVYSAGTLTVTRLDLTKGIIAGTFEFTLAKPGCDTIRVTNGRFDKKL